MERLGSCFSSFWEKVVSISQLNKIKFLIILLIFVQGGLLFLIYKINNYEINTEPVNLEIYNKIENSKEKSAQEKIEKEKEIKFLFFGDLMLDREVKEWIDQKGIDYLFENLVGEENSFFTGTDLMGLNFESVITKNGEHYPPEVSIDFAVSADRLSGLKKYGFNFFNLANNHMLDQGRAGYEETKSILKENEISFSGCPDKQVGDCSFTEKEIGGVKVAIAGFSMVYGVFDEKQAGEIVKELKSRNELVIVNIHWGIEYDKNFNHKQQQVAHDLIDAGADIIIGHHPHVVEGMEIYKNKPIFYSLGNFIFDQYFSKDTQTGLSVGINYLSEDIEFYLFPFTAIKGETKWLTGEEKKNFYKNFYDISDVSIKGYKDDIMEGKIKLYAN